MFNPLGFLTRYVMPDWLFYVLAIAVALYMLVELMLLADAKLATGNSRKTERESLLASFRLPFRVFRHYGTRTFGHFAGTGLKGPRPWPLMGNLPEFMSGGFRLDDQYRARFFFGRAPIVVTTDPNIIREVTIKEFSHFVNRNVKGFPIHETMAGGLTVVQDGEWKSIRSVISPTFSSGKLKRMTPLIVDCARLLADNVGDRADRNVEFDFKDLAGNYTMDVICQTFFGIQVESRVDEQHEENAFVRHAKAIFNGFSFRDPKMIFLLVVPPLAGIFEKLGISIFPNESLFFFRDNIFNLLKHRQDMSNPPNDFLQLMLEANTKADRSAGNDDEADDDTTSRAISSTDQTDATNAQIEGWNVGKRALTRQEILGNAMIFFLAGYETTATALGWLVYSMVLNDDVQERLYTAVQATLSKHNGELSYDAVADCHYVDQCFNETLRMYPPAGRTDRVCNEDVALADGKLKLKKGDNIHISVWGTHYDPELFPNPHKFDPDRWSTDNKGSIVPYSFLPFGLGPRNCVGMRLAILEAKIALMTLVRQFRFERSEKTDVPPKYKTTSLTTPLNGINIRVQRRATQAQ